MHWGGHGHHGHGPGGSLDEREDELGRVYDHQVVTRLLRYAKPYRRLLAASVATMLLYTLTSVAQPWIIKLGIDALVGAAERGNVGNLPWVVALFGLAVGVHALTNYSYLVSLAQVSQGVLYDLRSGIFNHLQRLSLAFYDRNEVGRVMSRAQNDVSQLQEFLGLAVNSLADLISLGGIVIALFLLDAQLAAITLTVIPVLVGIMLVWQRFSWGTFMRVRSAISVVNASLQENISGVRVIQALNRQRVNMEQFDRVNYNNLEANLRASRLSAALMPTVEVLTAVAIGLVVVFGGRMALQGEMEVSVVVAFVLYIQRFFDPIRNLTMQYTQFQRAMTSGVRIFNLLDAPVHVPDAPDARPLPELTGDVRLEGVRFHYLPGMEVIKGVDLHIRAGETAALVGHTGAGKTTLVGLLARFYDVTEGRILVDGHDLRDVTQASLARQMAMVLQEPFLFSGTIMQNIKYNRLDAPDEAAVAAATTVGAHDFIMRQPQGYDTPLQERGQNLSLGQRQLVSFARALLADPRILILDEATANIDSHTEAVIQRALAEVLRDRTAIVIAHRLSTVRNADRIVVLEDGRVLEQGSHDDLMSSGGRYADLYATYFASPEPARQAQVRGGSE
jgi:ABC-type multidrug transport system fused ATPase/permease subunit